MDESIAIKVENLIKTYPVYNNKQDRMREALSLTRKKYHADFHALNELNFEIKKGEAVGIIGQNGSGKSTLLKILTGVLSPTSGNILTNGRISALLELGAGFNPEMTGMENIYLNGIIMGYAKEEMEGRVPNIVEFADIGEFINQPVKFYSSGMFARLAFAVSINVEPDILIIDEALSVGDVFFQSKCYRKLSKLKQSGVTILFVSHDITAVRQFCNRTIWLKDGRMEDIGDTLKITEKYYQEQLIKMNMHFEHEDPKSGAFQKQSKSSNYLTEFPLLKSREGDLLSDKVKIESFFIKDENGNNTRTLFSDRTYSFHVVAEFHEDLDDLILGIKLENKRGVILFSLVTTFFQDKTFMAQNGECIEFIFSVKIPKIKLDECLVTVAIAQGSQMNHVQLTYLSHVTSIRFIHDGYDLGIIQLDSDFTLEVLDKEKIRFIEKKEA